MKLLNTYPTLKHMQNYRSNEEGDWFLLETNPCPSSIEEAIMIASDLVNDKHVFATYCGPLEHVNDCRGKHELEAEIEDAVKTIKYPNFIIAIWENPTSYLNHQPVAISLDPEINYYTYPDHPHINGVDQYLPESLCYTENPVDLGEDPFERISETIKILNTWLFKHLVWIETRKKGKGIWIGSAVDFQLTQQFLYDRNPDGFCRCGNKKSYKDCHLIYDFLSLNVCFPRLYNTYLKANGRFDIEKYTREYGDKNHQHKKILNEMKRLI